MKDIYNPLQFLGIEYCEQMFKKIVSTSRGFTSLDEDLLMCLLRPILIRHSQAQKYRNTETTLMSLPPKVRLVVYMRVCHSFNIIRSDVPPAMTDSIPVCCLLL